MSIQILGAIWLLAVIVAVAIYVSEFSAKRRIGIIISIILCFCTFVGYAAFISLLDRKGFSAAIDLTKCGSYTICAYCKNSCDWYLTVMERGYPVLKNLPQQITKDHYSSKTNQLVITESEGIKKFDLYLTEKGPRPSQKIETQ